MLRSLAVATIFLLAGGGALAQDPGTLHIRVAVAAPGQPPAPVAMHALLISDNPASGLPRRIFTGPDGTADVKLRPGNYTVESDRPVAIGGRVFQWTELVDIVAGADTLLELSAANAEVVEAPAEAPAVAASAAPPEANASSLLTAWQNSVVALWSPTAHGTGFLVDATGLIATSHGVVGTATSVEVQLDPTTKVAAIVLASDADRDVAVLAADPGPFAGRRPVPVTCQGATSALAEDEEVFAVSTPLTGGTTIGDGEIREIAGRMIDTDLALPVGSAGAPAFAANGTLIGIVTAGDDTNGAARGEWQVTRIESACDLIARAAESRKTAAVPGPARLPVETRGPLAEDLLAEVAKGRAGSLKPYTMSASDFDVVFITPVMIHAAQDVERGASRSRSEAPDRESLVRPLLDFANWSAYVESRPAVIFVRVTPKMVESFWTTVGRYAARTQGVDLPPFKRVSAGFSHLRAYCGGVEVTPVHPFKLEQRVSEDEAIYEGLYAFDPDAFGPECDGVKLELYSEKTPSRADTRVVDPKILEQVRRDVGLLDTRR